MPRDRGRIHDRLGHYPARFIGNYVNKGVKYVGVVAACVHLRKTGEDRVLWKYDDIDDAEAIRRAEEVRAITRRNGRPCLVFLESQLTTTDFAYDLNGGLMGSRQYFDVSSLKVEDVKSLAQELCDVTWSTLPKRNG